MEIEYNCTKMNKTSAGKAASICLFHQLLKRKDLYELRVDQRALADRLLAGWRGAIHKLSRANWKDVTGAGYSYLGNCPPCLGRWQRDAKYLPRFCKRAHVCPWCWARSRAYKSFDLFEKTLKTMGHKLGKEPAGNLGVFTHITKEEVELLPDVVADLADMQDQAIDQINSIWKRALRRAGVTGTIACMTYEPAREPNRVIVKGRFLCLAPMTANLARLCEKPPTLRPLTRANLARSIKRFALYPAGLLRRHPELAALILNTKGNSRLITVLGSLRAWHKPKPKRVSWKGYQLHSNN